MHLFLHRGLAFLFLLEGVCGGEKSGNTKTRILLPGKTDRVQLFLLKLEPRGGFKYQKIIAPEPFCHPSCSLEPLPKCAVHVNYSWLRPPQVSTSQRDTTHPFHTSWGVENQSRLPFPVILTLVYSSCCTQPPPPHLRDLSCPYGTGADM